MFVPDTNVLVYAANADAPEHDRCQALLLEWREREEPWHLTWSVVYECLRVVTDWRTFPNPYPINEAWALVRDLLSVRSLSLLLPTERHDEVAEAVLREHPDIAGIPVHDAHIAVLMREHGVRTIVTRDRGFRRFPFLEVVDPIA